MVLSSFISLAEISKARKTLGSYNYNCFYFAAMEVLKRGGQLFRGPPGLLNQTAHFWVVRKGKIIDPTKEQYEEVGGYPHYRAGKPVSVDRNIDAVIKHPFFKKEDKNLRKKILDRFIIDFPREEYDGIRARLNAGRDIMTTRVDDEQGRFKVGKVYMTVWGDVLQVRNVNTIFSLNDHPNYRDLTDVQKLLLVRYPRMDVVRLEKI